MTIKHPLSVLTLALAAALPISFSLPTAAQAQTSSYREAVRIDTIGVEPLRRLSAGKVLAFALDGTPRAEVTLEIAGASAPLRLTERRPGHYEGSYTIRPRDRLTATSLVTARIVKDGQSASATLSPSLLLGARDLAPVAATQITAFTVSANERVRPGDEVGFSLTGTPGGRASVAVRGITRRIPLTEVSRGVYEGSYVVRRDDQLRGELQADGYLQFDRRELSQRFERQAAREEAREQAQDRRDERDDLRAARDAREAEAVRKARQQAAFCAQCGSVESVKLVEVRGDAPNVIGTIAGGVIGGVIGNQVGGGSGKDIATVIGAIGGAYAGNRVENSMDKRKVYRVEVRMEGGTSQSFDYAEDPAVAIGTRVKVENGNLLRL